MDKDKLNVDDFIIIVCEYVRDNLSNVDSRSLWYMYPKKHDGIHRKAYKELLNA